MTLKQTVKDLVTESLYEYATPLFTKFPQLESFGWHQCTERWIDGRNVTFEESLQRPDISGALGEYLYSDPDGLQVAVSDLLVHIGPDLLMAAYGDGVDVTVYKDKTIEITDDTNRPVVYEL